MRAYPACKASGLEWLGEIPAHWEVKKLKYCDEVIMGQSPNSEDYQLEPDGLPFLQGNADFTQLYPKPRIWCNTANKIVETDDILLSVRAPIGAVNIADQRYGIGRGLCAIRSIKTDKKYLYYIALCLSDELNSIGTGSTFTAVSVDEIRNLPISQPRSLEEQRAIAAYLDHKTRLIDTYIAKKQQQVERWQAYRAALINQAVTKGLNPDTPMKASGIEWLGDIPAHWEVKRLVFVLERLQDGTHFSPKSDLSGDYLYITAKNIKEWGIDLSEVTYVSEEAHTEIYRRCPVRQEDVLYIKDGATAGIAIVNPIAEPFSMLSSVAMLRPKFNQYDSRYLAYHLNAKSFKEYALNSLVGGAMTRFTIEIISRFRLIAPPLHEQRAIAAYLDEQTAKIDTLVAATQRQLERLHAYRTALISEVVTGKLDVRGELMDNQALGINAQSQS